MSRRDHDRHCRDRYLHRRRVVAASWTRHAALCEGIAAGQNDKGSEGEDGGKKGPTAP